jgi:hypothetical protein
MKNPQELFIFSTVEETGFLWFKNHFIIKNSLKSKIKWGKINQLKGWLKAKMILKQENQPLTLLNKRICQPKLHSQILAVSKSNIARLRVVI